MTKLLQYAKLAGIALIAIAVLPVVLLYWVLRQFEQWELELEDADD